MQMTNYQHFYEACVVANYAMRHSDPMGKGIESGCKHLMELRREKSLSFNEALFNEYAASYKIMARLMIKERKRFIMHNRVGKMKHRLGLGLPAEPDSEEQQRRRALKAAKDFAPKSTHEKPV
jgi:hypothetical protein